MVAAPRYITFTIRKGEEWERLLVLKDRRTRRRRVPQQARAGIRPVEDTEAEATELTADVTTEGAILLSLTAEETAALDAGEYDFDVWATVPEGISGSSDYEDKPIVRGLITVYEYDEIAPPYPDDE